MTVMVRERERECTCKRERVCTGKREREYM